MSVIVELKTPVTYADVTYDAVTVEYPVSPTKQQKSMLVKFYCLVDSAEKQAQLAVMNKLQNNQANEAKDTAEPTEQAKVDSFFFLTAFASKTFTFELYEEFVALRKAIKAIIKFDGEELSDLVFEELDVKDVINVAGHFAVNFIKS